ncbi:hypothetical protein HRbin36_02179 [bacterium HR36]|nr:hypothetical protein HRbin36_02179 [bacterium HR36]
MSNAWADSMLNVLWRDLSRRGLEDPSVRRQCRADYVAACEYLVRERPGIGLITGFYIPTANCWESDGPPGAIFLGRCLSRLGYPVCFYAEFDLADILRYALALCGEAVPVVTYPPAETCAAWWQQERRRFNDREVCLVVIERPGPAHTPDSVLAQCGDERRIRDFLAMVPASNWDRLHTMSGQDVTEYHWPVHHWLEKSQARVLAIGDGGNEIGMGKLLWDGIARNVFHGARIACRIPADWLIVSSVSNWGAYAVATGICHLCGATQILADLAQPDLEKQLWQEVCQRYCLCDGVTGQPACRGEDFSIDGQPWQVHASVLEAIISALRADHHPSSC